MTIALKVFAVYLTATTAISNDKWFDDDDATRHANCRTDSLDHSFAAATRRTQLRNVVRCLSPSSYSVVEPSWAMES